MAMRFTLDFSIPTAKERTQYLKSNVDFSKLTKKDLELCADYCLYGKDPEQDNTSIVDRKNVFIKTKYGSYAKQEPLSLEALLENPTFDESELKVGKNIYKKIKPSIDREKCKDIPGMKELWEQIDRLDYKIKLKENKVEPKENEIIPDWDEKTLYHMKHRLIEMRKEQYSLKDSMFPEMAQSKNFGNYFVPQLDYEMNYPVYPRGVMRYEGDELFKQPWRTEGTTSCGDMEQELEERKRSGKPYFNFMDKEHIYQLCQSYYEIKDYGETMVDSPLNGLIWTLDYYIEKANLSEQQLLIVEGKKQHLLNKEICEQLMEKLGIYHQENYVSTIWNKVTQLIADAADLSYDEWCCRGYEPAWKVCSCCGEKLLRDPRNFVRKTKAQDGLTNRCKRCDQKKRRGEL